MQFFDSWRGGGTGKGAYVLSPQTVSQVALTVDGLSTSGASDILFRVRKSDGTVLFSVDNTGNISFAGSGVITVDTTVTGNLTVNGNTTLGNSTSQDTLTVNAAATFNGVVTAPTISGVTTFSNLTNFSQGITVTGTTNLNGQVNFNGNFTTQSIITFNSGQTVTGASYQIGRDVDATNQLHFNVPTSASFEFSVNDVAKLVLNTSALLPGATDGLALGSTTVMFSDIFLAAGSVYNVNNGAITMTEGTGRLTITGTDGSGIVLATGSDKNILLGGGGALYFRSTSTFVREATGLQIEGNGTIYSSGTSNFIIGASTAGTSAAKCLVLSNSATAPSDSADKVHLYSVDLSAGNAMLGIYAETAAQTAVATASTHKLPIKYNGTTYYILVSDV